MRTCNQLGGYFETQYRAIERLLPIVRLQPTGKPVHELRVATRRARAALWVLRNSAPEIHHRDVERRLRKLGRALGKIRELDVALMDAEKRNLPNRKLCKDQAQAQYAFRKRMTPKKSRHIVIALAETIDTLRVNPSIDFSTAIRKLSQLLSHEQQRTRVLGTSHHPLRIVIKKVRYSLDAMGIPTQPLRQLQTALGGVHDLEFLQTRGGKRRKLASECSTMNRELEPMICPALQSTLLELANYKKVQPRDTAETHL